MSNYNIRLESIDDYREVEVLTRNAFWNVYRPGAIEHFVVHNFRRLPEFISELSFVIEVDEKIIGHIMYSRGEINSDDGKVIPVVAFGPVSIAPDYQSLGYGTELIEHSLNHATKLGYGAVIISGSPEYYNRFGFVEAKTKNIYYANTNRDDDLPYFMVKELKEDYLNGIVGTYSDPSGYFVSDEDVEEFDLQFPYKEKLKLPTQLF